MGIQLNKLGQFKTMVLAQNPSAPIRCRLSDTELVDMLGECGTDALRHPEAAEKALAVMKAILALPTPDPKDVDAMFAWSRKFDVASTALWDAVHGEEIQGVEILRKNS